MCSINAPIFSSDEDGESDLNAAYTYTYTYTYTYGVRSRMNDRAPSFQLLPTCTCSSVTTTGLVIYIAADNGEQL
ncbi:hypothetical protein [Pontibacter sp. HJ8]